MIEVERIDPKPVVQPPTTFTISGLTQEHINYLRTVLARAPSIPINSELSMAISPYSNKVFFHGKR